MTTAKTNRKVEKLMIGERQYIAHYVTQDYIRRADILNSLSRNTKISAGPLMRAIRAIEELL
jgi:hypothetical protein